MIGEGGAARALAPALPADTRRFSRRGTWPPDATDCDLIVNATPVRDELLVVPQRRADGRRPRLRAEETALVAAARAAGCTVVDGREALVRQGAASFALWTGARAARRGDARRGQALDQASAPPARAAQAAADPEQEAAAMSRPLCCGECAHDRRRAGSSET